jgi:hypothetical protein
MVTYELRRSKRAKYMRLRVMPGGAVVVIAPHAARYGAIELFLRASAGWLESAISRMRQFRSLPVSGRAAYLKHKEAARSLALARLAHFNHLYCFQFGRVAIKNTKSLWGSCSRKGNLNFSYKILFLPPTLCDYVIVHELCHLQELNHSRHFWGLVEKALPEYRVHRTELRRYIHK